LEQDEEEKEVTFHVNADKNGIPIILAGAKFFLSLDKPK
jgi:hypothetical protein